MSNVSAYRRSQRRTALGFAVVYVAIAGLIAACSPGEAAPISAQVVDDTGATEQLVVTDTRLCAAVAVYGTGAGRSWDQAAVAARATLNRFEQLGEVPDCGVPLTRAVALGIRPDEWQRALDAVAAVESGSYALPPACDSAAHILPAPAASRAPCVIGELAFVESVR